MDILAKFAQATYVTVQITLGAALLAWLVSFVAGLCKLSSSRFISWPVTGIVEAIRGTSCYVQLFWLYFVLPLVGVEISAMAVAILAIGLNIGCYGSEVVRSSILAVPRGLREAARALNMNGVQTMVNVVIPNAFPRMLPPMCNLMVDLLKITPIVSLVTIADLTFLGQIYRQETGSPLKGFGILMVIYFLLSTLIIHAFKRLEIWASKGFEGTR
ncbi:MULTISPECIES: ectoine/hydroxyectoine ABC transporter permease subunit EhuC [unclassified Variovorax]|uniref:ectoine/hydroxyectoine ABC transporter permease subunit EhuC n=1 Tax=unclassified Variovorax TaxID=663243 RepID=UPI003F483A2E